MGANSLTVYPSSTIYSGQTVVVSYDQSAAGTDAIADPAGNEVADFTTGSGGVPAVTNNSTAMPPSTDATLSGLVVNDGSKDLALTPTFASDTYAYDASVASTVDEVTVTPTQNDSGATIEYLDASDMTLTDADTSADGQQVALAEGDNVINVKVTAADTTTTLTYKVTVNRPAAAPTCTLDTGDLWCWVVTVAALNVTGFGTVGYGFSDAQGGALSDTGFSVGTNDYTIDLLYVTAAETLYFSLTSALTDDEKEKLVLHIDGNSDTFAFSAAGGPTTTYGYDFVNTGLDWSSTSEVTLRLQLRPASTDATLSALVVNDGSSDLTLTPTFASDTETYDASVANTVDEVTVTPTKNDSGASIVWLDGSDMTLADADTSAAGQQVTLAEGDNVIKVKVTAEDTTTTRTYTVTVNRPAATPSTCTLDTGAGDIWCGVVTVGELSDSDGFLGTIGSLSDTQFAYGSNVYTIDAVYVTDSARLGFSLTSTLTAAATANLELQVDGNSGSFAFSTATHSPVNNNYAWSATGLDWSSTSEVTLRLREALAAPAAPTNFTAMAGDAQVELAWDAPASDSGVTRHEYHYKTDGSYGNWAQITNSGVGGANQAAVHGDGVDQRHGLHVRAARGERRGDGADRAGGAGDADDDGHYADDRQRGGDVDAIGVGHLRGGRRHRVHGDLQRCGGSGRGSGLQVRARRHGRRASCRCGVRVGQRHDRAGLQLHRGVERLGQQRHFPVRRRRPEQPGRPGEARY